MSVGIEALWRGLSDRFNPIKRAQPRRGCGPVDNITVAEVMKDAGLTHGAFYGYFPSKEALIAEAVRHALPPAPDEAKPRRPAADYAFDGYLSVRHRDNRATSCLFSSLGTEAARGSAELRHGMTEGVRRRISYLSVEAEGDKPKEKRRAAIAAWSAISARWFLPVPSTMRHSRRKS